MKRKCKWCEIIITVRPSEIRKNRKLFCNRQCYLAWRKKQRTIKCKGCGKVFERHNIKRQFCSYKCWLKQWRFTRKDRLKNKRYKVKRGYIMVVSDEGKNVFEHRYTWEKYYGRLPDGWLVHHLNGKQDDNRIENLQGMARKEHNPRKIIEPYQKRIKELERKLAIYYIDKELK